MHQSEIREHLNRFMTPGKAYHTQEIYDHLEASASSTLQHRIRAALQIAKSKGQVHNIERSGWHTRIEYIQ